MKKIEGTATIDLEQLDYFRKTEEEHSNLKKILGKIVAGIETGEYEKRCKEIDSTDVENDEELEKMMYEAAKTIKIVLSEKVLRKIVKENIPEKEKGSWEIGEMEQKEFENIEIMIRKDIHKKD